MGVREREMVCVSWVRESLRVGEREWVRERVGGCLCEREREGERENEWNE